jgi:hypothetical protein
VRWAERGRFGMEFVEPLDLASVSPVRGALARAG